MLNGACRKLLGLLPAEVRQQFDRELCHILSSNGTGQNSMLLLWCFGIVILAEHPDEFSESQIFGLNQPTSTAGHEKQCETASGRKLFGSPNGVYKTINLTYLSVIWATKGDVGVSDAEAIEGIRIAVRTLRFMDIEARTGWSNSSALAKNIFPKLPAKILRGAINPAVQLEALCFFAMSAGANNLPMEIVTQYQRCLATLEDLADPGALREILLVSLPIFAPQMQDSLFRTVLSDLLDTCVSELASRPLNALVTLVDTLSAVSLSCPVLSTKLLHALSSSTLQGKAWSLVRNTTSSKDLTCRTYAASLHQEVLAATISMILNLAITVRLEEPTLPPQLIYGLITRQRDLPSVPKHCLHAASSLNSTSISLFQQESTPFTGQHLQDWRNRLKSELESQNSYQRDSIVRSVAQICHDLETRCNTVEEPLRQEKARSRELEQRVDELSEQVSSLESQAADDRFHLDGLEDEKLGLAEEKDQISARLDELRMRFEETNRDADEALRKATEEFNARELELRSTILNHEEQFQAREGTVRELSGTLSEVRSSLEHTEEELRALGNRYEDLQSRLGDTGRQLDDEREANSRQSEEILRLRERSINLEHQLQTAESEIEVITGQLSDLEVSHQELRRSADEAFRDLEAKYTADMEASAMKAREEHDKLNNKLTNTVQNNQQLKDSHDKTRTELHALQNTFSTLEMKAQDLEILCGEQEEELEELRTLRRNVLASMGLATQNPLAIRSASRSQKDGTVPETPREPREHRRRKSAIQTQDAASKVSRATQDFTNTAMENVAEVSFASSDQGSQNGSTPKRQKPRPAFKAPTMQTPFDSTPALISRSTSKKLSPVKRSALRQLSPNRRHTTVGFTGVSEREDQEQTHGPASTRKRRGSLRGASQEDFDMDEFLAGTPFTPGAFASGTGRLPDDDEATTTEL
ncbi:hypothetical protein E8E12_003734 [Didymella heteroderae]|uniref:Uncharacterized protein n=1 Tax=Didymella heteroderae TaxID=1769908 RepID=A0A9P4WR76_9PLEO|nr:hypothetical protein E8E12_003734 [Didymella heteroderae]